MLCECSLPHWAFFQILICIIDIYVCRFERFWKLIQYIGVPFPRRVSLVEQELPTLPEHLSSPPVFSGARVTRSLVLYVCFVDRCLSFCTFSVGHCVVCSSSIYGFWLPLNLVSSNCSYYSQISLTSDWTWTIKFSQGTVKIS